MLSCVDCHVALVNPADHPGASAQQPPPAKIRLGRFHPPVADLISQLLDRRDIPYTMRLHDDAVEVLVDPTWRDDLRTELAVSWDELLGNLADDAATETRALGGNAPGWFDAPQGGYVDRLGRMVVEVADEDREIDGSRVVGPALLACGAVLIATGWLLVEAGSIVAAGIGLALLGLFVPR